MRFDVPELSELIQALKKFKSDWKNVGNGANQVDASAWYQGSYSTIKDKKTHVKTPTAFEQWLNKNQQDTSNKNTISNASLPAFSRAMANAFRAVMTGSPATAIQNLGALGGLAGPLGSLGGALGIATAALATIGAGLKMADASIGVKEQVKYSAAALGNTKATKEIIKFSEATGLSPETLIETAAKEPLGWDTLKRKIDIIRNASTDREAAIIAKSMGLSGFERVRNLDKRDYEEAMKGGGIEVNDRVINRRRKAQAKMAEVQRNIGDWFADLGAGVVETAEMIANPKQWFDDIFNKIKEDADKKRKKTPTPTKTSTNTEAETMSPNTSPFGGNNVTRTAPGAAYPGAWDYNLNSFRDFDAIERLGAFNW